MPYTYQSPAPTPRPGNGLAIAGFVLGLLGLLFSFIPIVGVIAWPMVILGLVFGVVGVKKAISGNAAHKGLAIAAIALSAVGLLMCVLYAAVFTSAVSTAAHEPNSLPSAPKIGAAQGNGATGAIGKPVASGDMTFTVTRTQRASTVGDQQFGMGQKAQGKFLIVSLSVQNTGSKSVTFSDSEQKVLDSKGNEYSADSMAGIALNSNNNVWLQEINPGNTVRGKLVFDLPTGVTPAKIQLQDPFSFAEPATVTLK